ncbi:MAG: HEAT repeat domain-containing protein [Pseudomonadota bacterium]
MNHFTKTLLLTLIVTLGIPSAFADTPTDKDQLKISAIESLMATSSEKALPILSRVMTSDNSDVVKSRALFVIGQFDVPESRAILLDLARGTNANLQASAIRTIGINGNADALAQLDDIFKNGDNTVKQHILQAYLIADDAEAMFKAAVAAEDSRVFDSAVQKLGAMGATQQLKQLRERAGTSQSLIHAYAIAGDTESLLAIAKDSANPTQQTHAIHSLGIADDGPKTGEALIDIYRSSQNDTVRRAVMNGLMVGDFDDHLLTLFSESTDQKEKAELLRQLVIMDSDIAMQAIDSALSE